MPNLVSLLGDGDSRAQGDWSVCRRETVVFDSDVTEI